MTREGGSIVAADVERRIVTVLFGDLVGFTSLSERLDAEDVATIQDAYFALVRETIGRHGGQLEKFIGDAAMAVFGVPRGREDDAERAVAAGLALVAGVEQLGARLGLDSGELRLRVGVTTGEVVHAVEGPDAGRVTGDTVNTAARLQTAAEPGTVVIGEDTALAVAGGVEVVALEPLTLKGKAEPVRAWRADRLRPQRSRELAMGSLKAPTIGREEEIALVVGSAEAAFAERRRERWLVVAPPGVGKTRLVEEIGRRLESSSFAPVVWRIRLRPEATAAYEPLRAVARSVVQLGDVRSRLAAARVPAARAEVLAHELAELAGPADVDEAPDPADAREPAERAHAPGATTAAGGVGADRTAADRARRFDAWLEALDALQPAPHAWLVEDLHWGSPDLLAFFDAALARPSPVGRFILATARPAILDTLAGGASAAPEASRAADVGAAGTVSDGGVADRRLELATLPATDARRLVEALVGDALPEGLVAEIAERSDGNCLFIEELLRTWVGTGALVPEAEREPGQPTWRLTLSPTRVPLPATVQAIYAAQLDDLPGPARQAARRAAVAGRRFPSGALGSLGVSEPADAVEELRRRALVAGPQSEPIAGDTFAYRHALLRDAGYASLARADRAELHVRLARWLESAAGASVDRVAARIGDHLSRAVENAPALAREIVAGLTRDDAAREAAGWLEHGAIAALHEGAVGTAADLLRRAAELTLEDSPADLARRLTRLGRALAPIGGIEEAEAAYRRAADAARVARSAGDPAWRERFGEAVSGLGDLLFERIRFVEAWQLGEAALVEMGDVEDLPTARVRLARSRGQAGERNDATRWVEDAERAVAVAAAVGDEAAEYEFRRDLAGARSEAGLATAEEWMAFADLARAHADAAGEVSARVMVAAYRLMDRPADAPAILRPARELAIAHGLVERLGWVEHAATEAALGSGDWDAAIESGLRALDLGERHGYDRIAVRTLASLLPVASLRGEATILERADRWFEARAGHLPDSPYGRVLHAAARLWIRPDAVRHGDVPDLDHLRDSIPEWLAQGGFEWLASCDAILDAWFVAGRREWVAEVVEEAPRQAKVGDPSPATPVGLELHAIRLRALGPSEDDLEARTRGALETFREIGLPFWIARGLRMLELIGAATETDRAERDRIERGLAVVRPTLVTSA